MAERPGISAVRQGAPFATRFGPPAPGLADRVLALERALASGGVASAEYDPASGNLVFRSAAGNAVSEIPVSSFAPAPEDPRYALVSPEPDAEGAVQLQDRAVNAVSPAVAAVGHWTWSDGVDRGAPPIDPADGAYSSVDPFWYVGDNSDDTGGAPTEIWYQREGYLDFTVTAVDAGTGTITVARDGQSHVGTYVRDMDGDEVLIVECYFSFTHADAYGTVYVDTAKYPEGGGDFAVGDTVALYFTGDLVAEGYDEYVSDVSSLVLPPAVPGRARDFLVRLAIPANFTFSWPALPDGGAYETAGGTMPDVSAEGTYLVSFTETAPSRFAVSAKELKGVPV